MGLLLDCQSDLLAHLGSRLVLPLIRPGETPPGLGRLNPVFAIGGEQFMLVTQYAAAIDKRELGPVVASLAEHDREIMNALDLLLTGV